MKEAIGAECWMLELTESIKRNVSLHSHQPNEFKSLKQGQGLNWDL